MGVPDFTNQLTRQSILTTISVSDTIAQGFYSSLIQASGYGVIGVLRFSVNKTTDALKSGVIFRYILDGSAILSCGIGDIVAGTTLHHSWPVRVISAEAGAVWHFEIVQPFQFYTDIDIWLYNDSAGTLTSRAGGQYSVYT